MAERLRQALEQPVLQRLDRRGRELGFEVEFRSDRAGQRRDEVDERALLVPVAERSGRFGVGGNRAVHHPLGGLEDAGDLVRAVGLRNLVRVVVFYSLVRGLELRTRALDGVVRAVEALVELRVVEDVAPRREELLAVELRRGDTSASGSRYADSGCVQATASERRDSCMLYFIDLFI
jgi:hypothetical protein